MPMMRRQKTNLLVLILFTFLTLLMTYPTVLHLGSSVKDSGDPLLNTWIISWNIKKISNFDFKNYFDANIFYPQSRTLAYSEFLFSQSLAALPVYLLSQNPIFTYNFIYLLAFLTSAYGMFLLARYLTNNTLGGIVAGLIYAFSPFMFGHLGHLQIISAGGIPLAFLYLHKFFKNETYRHLLLFTLFYLIQVLANGYYALYLTFYSGLFLIIYMSARKRFLDYRFWLKIVCLLLVVLAVAGPFFYQYFLVHKEMGFFRKNTINADWTSFLATSPLNKIYGHLTAKFQRGERALFPGIIAFALAIIGIMASRKKRKRLKPWLERYELIYLFILLLSFLFTFGNKGPYIILYKFLPGFEGLRVAARFHIFVMLPVAVLAAFGAKWLWSSLAFPRRVIYLMGVSICLLIIIEYLSIPLPYLRVPVNNKIPEVYKWLAAKEGDLAIIELPLPQPQQGFYLKEAPRVYYSLYHRKKLVNGYSGYFPPLYRELQQRWQRNCLEQNIQELRELRVKYLILHFSFYKKKRFGDILQRLSKLKKEVKFVKKLGEAYVYKLLPLEHRTQKIITWDKTKALSKKGWKAEASVKKRKASLAIDDNISTRWSSGPQKKGIFFELDLGRPYLIRGLSLKLGPKYSDYPRGYQVELSTDKIKWMTVAREEKTDFPLAAFIKGSDISLNISFSLSPARYIKITNIREDKSHHWSIYELEVFK